ncbi:carboxylesterase/lipase family protein [Pseudonocardia xinjiangensis]|uniref:carboxylesterase/lipase family protein n=1 Tax=Pseudonocardia xinjiangensis TaxID=75289 RepID=UPI003D8C3EAD
MIGGGRASVVMLLAAAAVLVACSPAPPAVTPPLGEHVRIAQGELAGSSDSGMLRFQGIPYAAPPVGPLRWQPPQPAAGWSGTRSAARPGNRCAQVGAGTDVPHGTPGSTSEDCLTLNVTVPVGTTPTSRLPVLFWIHGGGFNAGAGSDVDPRRLAAAGPLVVVTINYRLGIFGFFGLHGLPGSGSFALLDQQAAMHWVRRNIAAFGGDPGSVTLAGESAGADSVCAQLSSPGAVGLYQRAILQSGGCSTANIVDVIRPGAGPGGDTWKPLPLVEAAGAGVATALGCPDPARTPVAALACMRALPTERLVDGAGVYWSPATGTATLPRRPSDIVVDGDLRPTPLLAGTTRDEGTLFTAAFFDRGGGPLTEAGFRTLLGAAAGSRSAVATRSYPLGGGRSPGRVWSDVVTDRGYACTALATHRLLGARAPLYAYEFADPTAPSPFAALPPHLATGVTHGAEMPYLFDLVPGQPPLAADQQVLATEMVGAWARFAATGNPNGGSGPVWPHWAGDGSILTITGPGRGTVARPAAEFAAEHRCSLWDLG